MQLKGTQISHLCTIKALHILLFENNMVLTSFSKAARDVVVRRGRGIAEFDRQGPCLFAVCPYRLDLHQPRASGLGYGSSSASMVLLLGSSALRWSGRMWQQSTIDELIKDLCSHLKNKSGFRRIALKKCKSCKSWKLQHRDAVRESVILQKCRLSFTLEK